MNTVVGSINNINQGCPSTLDLFPLKEMKALFYIKLADHSTNIF